LYLGDRVFKYTGATEVLTLLYQHNPLTPLSAQIHDIVHNIIHFMQVSRKNKPTQMSK